MTLLASLPRIEEHRVPVVFDCPKCRAAHVRGTAYNLRETICLTGRTPSWGWSSHWVRCSECGAELSSDCEPETFQESPAVNVQEHVHLYRSFPKRVLAVASVVLCWAPMVGLLVAVVARLSNAHTRGWPRLLSIVMLCVTGVYNAALFGWLVHWTIMAGTPVTG